jgi:hypothetical protein
MFPTPYPIKSRRIILNYQGLLSRFLSNRRVPILYPNFLSNQAAVLGGRDSIPVRGVPYEPIALLRVYRTKIKLNSS